MSVNLQFSYIETHDCRTDILNCYMIILQNLLSRTEVAKHCGLLCALLQLSHLVFIDLASEGLEIMSIMDSCLAKNLDSIFNIFKHLRTCWNHNRQLWSLCFILSLANNLIGIAIICLFSGKYGCSWFSTAVVFDKSSLNYANVYCVSTPKVWGWLPKLSNLSELIIAWRP